MRDVIVAQIIRHGTRAININKHLRIKKSVINSEIYSRKRQRRGGTLKDMEIISIDGAEKKNRNSEENN